MNANSLHNDAMLWRLHPDSPAFQPLREHERLHDATTQYDNNQRQLRTATTCCNSLLHLRTATTCCNYLLRLRTATTCCNYLLPLRTTTTTTCYSYVLPSQRQQRVTPSMVPPHVTTLCGYFASPVGLPRRSTVIGRIAISSGAFHPLPSRARDIVTGEYPIRMMRRV